MGAHEPASARHAKSKARVGAYEQLLAEDAERQARRASRSTSRPARASATSSSRPTDVAKGFGDRLLVEDMTFSLPPGGIVGVIGPNGAGKTTLFRMIAGEEQPDSGTLTGRRHGRARLRRPGARRPRRRENTVWKEISGNQDIDPARQARGELAPVRLLVQLPRRRPAEEGRRPLGRRAQPRPPREAAALGRQRAAARRADERPRRRHAARARGRAARLRRLRGRDQPRSLVPRPRSRRTSSPSRATAR